MRRPLQLVLVVAAVACGSNGASGPSSAVDASAEAAAGDAGGEDSEPEGPIPPAPAEPGCAMSIDGEPMPASLGGARVGRGVGGPEVELRCAGVSIYIIEPRGPGEYEARAEFGVFPRPEYRGRCTTRLDRIAIEERGGLAARVRCDVPLMRDESKTGKQRVRLEGYVVLPPAGPIAAATPEPITADQCMYSTTGEYTLEGRGSASSAGCGDNRFSFLAGLPAAVIRGTFCPTCTTYYDQGTCTNTNEVSADGRVAYDATCDLAHELAGSLHVKVHLEGPIVLPP